MKYKEKEININGDVLMLRERSCQDVFDTDEYFAKTEFEESDARIFMKKHLVMINQALKNNWDNIKWYEFKRRATAKKYSVANMTELIPMSYLWDISIYLYELENTDTTFLKMMAGKLSKNEIEKYKKTAEKKNLEAPTINTSPEK